MLGQRWDTLHLQRWPNIESQRWSNKVNNVGPTLGQRMRAVWVFLSGTQSGATLWWFPKIDTGNNYFFSVKVTNSRMPNAPYSMEHVPMLRETDMKSNFNCKLLPWIAAADPDVPVGSFFSGQRFLNPKFNRHCSVFRQFERILVLGPELQEV